MNCSKCDAKMIEKSGCMPDGVSYSYYSCPKCGEEVLNMEQVHKMANKYREMKRHKAKVSKWGSSLGVRIPKDLAERYKIKDSSEVTIIPEDNGMRIIPSS